MTEKRLPAMKAAIAIINSTVNPALRHDAINVNSRNLAEIIERETAVSELLEVLKAVLCLDLERLDAVNGASIRKAARAAIAKATGQEAV